MEAQVLNGDSYALTVVPASRHPSDGSSSRSHSWSAWVAVVWTCSTMACHSRRSSISSRQTIGAMPTGMAKTATSEHAGLRIGPVAEVGLERLAFDLVRRVELVHERGRRKAREATDPHQRI